MATRHTGKALSRRERTPTDYHQEVTDRIIAALEQGTVPWQRPWDQSRAGRSSLPMNATTNRRYNGINVLLLAMSPLMMMGNNPRWCSYKQAQARGWQVRGGEAGTTIFFFRKLAVRDDQVGGAGAGAASGAGDKKFIPMLRTSKVFHASQMDGIPALVEEERTETTWRKPEAVETIVANSGAMVRIGGAAAYFCPGTDHIQMPDHTLFHSPESWATTMLHELGHWTGAPGRLDRDMTGKFGTPSYAMEELRAELGSCMACAELGLPSEIPNHASYIAHWLPKLREDKRAIFRAATDAQRIADYCLAFHPGYAAENAGSDDEAEADETALDKAA